MPFSNPHPLYSVWQSMRRRCLTPTSKQYHDYGGRGISICRQWDSFEQFISDMGPRPSAQHTLDRIDNDGNYEPGNCRWATRKEQQRNRRVTKRVTIGGREYLAADLAERYGLKVDTVVDRAAKGMTFAKVTAKTRYVDTSSWRKAVDTRVAKQLAATHCKHGHPWTPENTYQTPKQRVCRTCHRLKVALQRERKRVS